MPLHVAGENIEAGESIILANDGKLYRERRLHGNFVGEAVENIRMGLRVFIDDDGKAREDDA